LDAPEHWEALVFEHYHAVVRTLATSLATPDAENTASATYTFDLWPGHPMAHEVEKLFQNVRAEVSALRGRIDAHNAKQPARRYERVMMYLGMCEDRPRVIESPSTVTPTAFHDPDAELDE
jgi:hypothetical protein